MPVRSSEMLSLETRAPIGSEVESRVAPELSLAGLEGGPVDVDQYPAWANAWWLENISRFGIG